MIFPGAVERNSALAGMNDITSSAAAEMSGSGSACFGIFETLAQAQRAAENFRDMAFCHACAGIGNAEQM